MQIGNGVVVEAGAVVEAKIVGDGCVIEVNARIGKGAVLGKVRLSFRPWLFFGTNWPWLAL